MIRQRRPQQFLGLCNPRISKQRWCDGIGHVLPELYDLKLNRVQSAGGRRIIRVKYDARSAAKPPPSQASSTVRLIISPVPPANSPRSAHPSNECQTPPAPANPAPAVPPKQSY